MVADEKLLKRWCELAPGEYIDGLDVLSTVRDAIKHRGWELQVETTSVEGRAVLRACVTHGVPVSSMLGETDAVLAAYIDALDAERWVRDGYL